MPRRRIWFYLLLNILVSALVTGGILLAYDRYYRPDCSTAVAPTLPSTPVSPVVGDVNVNISSVIGAGIAESEIVVIKNNGANPVILNGWNLRDSEGNTYTFPEIKLNANGTIQVHTTAGTDRLPDLYWGRTEPVWKPGDTASLFDAQGTLRAIYQIP